MERHGRHRPAAPARRRRPSRRCRPTDRRGRPHEGPPRRRHVRTVPPELRTGGREPDAGPFAAHDGGAAVDAATARRGRHPRRRGERPRHREASATPVAGLQDERRHAAGAARPDPGRRGGARGDGRHDVGDGRPRGRPRRARCRGGAVADADDRVEQVLIVDAGQATSAMRCADTRVVQFDRRKRELVDEAGVIAKFGVPRQSIPDYLGLVGDSADGFPGIAGWGAKSAAAVLARYGHLEDIPDHAGQWDVPGCAVPPSCPSPCATTYDLGAAVPPHRHRRADVDVGHGGHDWAWTGPTPGFAQWAEAARATPGRSPGQRAARSRGGLRRTSRRRGAIGARPSGSSARRGDGRVLCNGCPRTRSGPGGSSLQRHRPVCRRSPGRRLTVHGRGTGKGCESGRIGTLWKVCVGQPTVGSNPTSSALTMLSQAFSGARMAPNLPKDGGMLAPWTTTTAMGWPSPRPPGPRARRRADRGRRGRVRAR